MKQTLIRRAFPIAIVAAFLALMLAQAAYALVPFDPVVNASVTSDMSVHPQTAVSGSNVYVIWEENLGYRPEVYFNRSTDNRATFGTAINLSNNARSSMLLGENQMIAVSGNNIYAVWMDDTPGNNEIFFTRSTDGG